MLTLIFPNVFGLCHSAVLIRIAEKSGGKKKEKRNNCGEAQPIIDSDLSLKQRTKPLKQPEKTLRKMLTK